jgi:hypothetical protein
MGLMEDLGAWLDQKKKNVAVNAQNLPGLLSSFTQDVQQGAAADKSAWDASRSVMPEVRAQGVAEMNQRGQELGGLLGSIARAAPKQIAAGKRFKSGDKEGIYRGSEAFGGIVPAKLGSMRANYIEAAQTGAPYSKYWYDDTSRDLWRITGEDINKADPLAEVLATTSSSTPVNSNAMYGFKGWNQNLAGDKINTGKYPTRMSQDIDAILNGGQLASGLKRSPYAGGLSVAWRPDPDLLAVNDIHNVRAWGITDPVTGGEWKKGVGEAGHRFLQDQHKVVAQRLNEYAASNIAVARAAGASEADIAKMIQPDWNNYRAQAAAWSTQRNRGPQNIPFTEAGKHYGDFLNDYSSQITREWLPGDNTGHAQGLLSMPYPVQKEFSDIMEANVRGPQGIDRIGSDTGALADRTLDNRAVYEGAVSPGYASQILVGKGRGSQNMDPSSRKIVNAIAATHGLLGAQKQVAHNFIGGKAPVGEAGAFQLRSANAQPFSVDQLGLLASKAPNADIPQVDPRGARSLVFAPRVKETELTALEDAGLSGAMSGERGLLGASKKKEAAKVRTGLLAEMRKAAKDMGATVEPRFADTTLFPMDANFNAPATWSAKPYIRAIEKAGQKYVDNWNANVPMIAGNMLRDAEAFFTKHNLVAAPWYKPMMEGIAKGGLPELKRLVKAGIVPVAALAAFGLQPDDTQ